MICPQCGFENLAGEALCSSCMSSLTGRVDDENATGLGYRLMAEPVGPLLSIAPVCVQPEDSLKSVMSTMIDKHVGCVLVVENKNLVGIFTERDILLKIAGKDINFDKEIVGEYMTMRPEMLDENHSIAQGLNKMSVGGYRHLPVMAKGQLKGVVSVRDLLRYIQPK